MFLARDSLKRLIGVKPPLYDGPDLDTLLTTNLVRDRKVVGRNRVAGDDATGWLAPAPQIYNASTNRLVHEPPGYVHDRETFMSQPEYLNRLHHLHKKFAYDTYTHPALDSAARATWTPEPQISHMPAYPGP